MEWIPKIDLTDEPAEKPWRELQKYREEQNPGAYSGAPSKGYKFEDPCQECGMPKTEIVDLGNEWYYECWWCTERTAEPPKK